MPELHVTNFVFLTLTFDYNTKSFTICFHMFYTKLYAVCTQASIRPLQFKGDLWVSEHILSLSWTLQLWFSSLVILKLISLNFQDWILIQKMERAAKLQETTEACLKMQKEQTLEISMRVTRLSCSLSVPVFIHLLIQHVLYASLNIYSCLCRHDTFLFPSKPPSFCNHWCRIKISSFYAWHPPLLKLCSSYGINQNMRHIILSHLVCQIGMKQWVTKPVAHMGGTSEIGYGQSLDITEINWLINYSCVGVHV